MDNNEYLPMWEQHTRSIFWSVALANLVGFVCTVFVVIHILPLMFSAIESSFYDDCAAEEAFSQFTIAFIVMKVLVLAGYVGYIMGLAGFASVQPDEEAAAAVRSARMGVIILTVTSVLYFTIPSLAHEGTTVGLVAFLVLWVADIVGYSLMRAGFKHLSLRPDFSEQAVLGAENLRYGAVCGIRMLVLPVVTLLLVALIILMTAHSAASSASHLNMTGVNFQSFDSLTGTIAQLASLFQSGGFFLMVVAVTAFILSLCWGFSALAKPIVGWSRIRSGYLVEPAEPEPLSSEPETVPAKQQEDEA